MNQVAINAGTIVGYTLSGLLIGTPVLGWRTIFLVNVPVGLFGTYWSKKRLREIHHSSHREKFDKLGALTFSSSLTSLLLGLTLGGLTSPLTLTLVTLSILLMALFLLLERRAEHPRPRPLPPSQPPFTTRTITKP